VTIYIAAATVFLFIQHRLPESSRIALDFYEPYQLGWYGAVNKLFVAVVLALVLYPFRRLLDDRRRGVLVLFTALWGIALLGNLDPRPGSIEGMIYTTTSLGEHLLVLLVGGLQFLLVSWGFVRWQSSAQSGEKLPEQDISPEYPSGGRLKGYLLRFTLVHFLVYQIVGSLFYQISGYEEALATMEAFSLWRPLESLTMVAAVFFGQIARGMLLALFFSPFYKVFISRKQGWLMLFGLLVGLKVFSTSSLIPESWSFEVQELLVGLPEVFAQTLVFALLFFSWERRRIGKKSEVALS